MLVRKICRSNVILTFGTHLHDPCQAFFKLHSHANFRNFLCSYLTHRRWNVFFMKEIVISMRRSKKNIPSNCKNLSCASLDTMKCKWNFDRCATKETLIVSNYIKKKSCEWSFSHQSALNRSEESALVFAKLEDWLIIDNERKFEDETTAETILCSFWYYLDFMENNWIKKNFLRNNFY